MDILNEEELSVLNLISEHKLLTYNEILKKVNISKNKVLLTLNKLLSLKLIKKYKSNNKIYFTQ